MVSQMILGIVVVLVLAISLSKEKYSELVVFGIGFLTIILFFVFKP
jgi:hypothetical protein